ncbi:hypothetical protein [Streptomyces sp. NPDC015130]|uniref:hypothetical protein n=1 Tax=Streptomyces sp. NPDC015130 TaxID=3364940 RepID=UPI0036F8900B
MADTTPTPDRQRALAINHVSRILNAADLWAEPETCDAIVTAVLAAHQDPSPNSQQTERRLTVREHGKAWHAIEGASGAEDADPGTVLAAVLRALDITAPSAEDELADSLRRRQDAKRQASGQQPDTAIVNQFIHHMATDHPAATHFCGSCDGTDPTSCLMNPDPGVREHLDRLRDECASQLAAEDQPQC